MLLKKNKFNIAVLAGSALVGVLGVGEAWGSAESRPKMPTIEDVAALKLRPKMPAIEDKPLKARTLDSLAFDKEREKQVEIARLAKDEILRPKLKEFTKEQKLLKQLIDKAESFSLPVPNLSLFDKEVQTINLSITAELKRLREQTTSITKINDDINKLKLEKLQELQSKLKLQKEKANNIAQNDTELQQSRKELSNLEDSIKAIAQTGNKEANQLILPKEIYTLQKSLNVLLDKRKTHEDLAATANSKISALDAKIKYIQSKKIEQEELLTNEKL